MIREIGESPILVAENVHCDECGREHDFEKCPKCGSWIEIGYGLCFGGFGAYKYCSNDSCDWYWKRLEDLEER